LMTNEKKGFRQITNCNRFLLALAKAEKRIDHFFFG
jgi:hypothetical protein